MVFVLKTLNQGILDKIVKKEYYEKNQKNEEKENLFLLIHNHIILRNVLLRIVNFLEYYLQMR